MSAHSGADEEVLYKPFTVQALLTAIARPCRVSDRNNSRESKIVLLETALLPTLFVTKKTNWGEGREGKRKGKGRAGQKSFMFL